MIYAYPQEVHDFVRDHVKGRRPAELAEMCNAALGTDFTTDRMKAFMSNHHYTNGLGRYTKEEYNKYCSKWPDGMYEFVVENSYGVNSKDLAKMVNDKFGINISQQNMKAYCQRRGIKRGISGWFQKGHEPGNKGKKWEEYLTPEAIEKAKKTTFPKGHVPANYVPVGTVTVIGGDKLIKMRDDGEQWERWRYLSRVTWEKHNGPIPEGMCVSFKDHDNMNCDISNLMLVSRGEIATMAKLGLWSEDPDLTETGLALVKLKHKVTKIRKERKKDDRIEREVERREHE